MQIFHGLLRLRNMRNYIVAFNLGGSDEIKQTVRESRI